MSGLGHHSEWLSLIEVSGPFLAEPVLKDAFPQGLEGLDSAKKTTVRQAYDEWREALDLDDPDFPKIHRAWIDLILKRILELDENDTRDVLRSTEKLPDTIRCDLPEHGITLRPDYAVMDGQEESRPLILITVYDPDVSLAEPLKGDGWAANPAERMVELCRATNVRLGLVTNGEQWMLVDAPVGAVTTFASWYARHWGQEPVTLQAFVSLLGIRRFFVDRSEQLPAMLDNSLKFQDEVTDALGEQVRRAVEVLIQALDRADVDRNRELLDGIEPAELYEAGLTVMMRIVFLLSAEERGLLLLEDARYQLNYAVSTLRMQLRSESEEILERRWDAWSRLLSIFRAVYGGVDHEAMRLPALGGSLFDPDRFPFLEGRKKGSRWKTDPATPLPIDNRTVLYLLDAVQLFQGRTLSYLALDVEQIGYVYEGLLERTVVRAKEATLDLDATKNAKNPWVSLAELDDAAAKGRQAVEELLEDRTGSSASRVRNDLDKTVDEESADKLLTACHADQSLRDRMRPYFHLLRTDRWGYPLVYPKGAFLVATGADRRETGTHYTPKSLTEMIVKNTLEPLVYAGPDAGKPREDWALKSPAELLDLKICDLAMGSGAFLVQVCRWLSERLVEAWAQAEVLGKAITSHGEIVDEIGSREPLRRDVEERLLTAKRLIAERCIYGVDMNPLAVELAKLSIWLITLAKGRPFGFLDHNLRCGDSLLGITTLGQLYSLELNPSPHALKKLFARDIDKAADEAIRLRLDLRSKPVNDIRDVEAMADLDQCARAQLELPSLAADALVGEFLATDGGATDTTMLSIEIGDALKVDPSSVDHLRSRSISGLKTDLPPQRTPRHPFHWPLEFPEVFLRDQGGFDAIVGNPPFLGGQRITGAMGTAYRGFLVGCIAKGVRGSADLVAYFFLRAFDLLRIGGNFGLLAVNTVAEGDTRQVGLERLIREFGATIYAAFPNEPWPGTAAVVTSRVHIRKGDWKGDSVLSGRCVPFISAFLSNQEEWSPKALKSNAGKCFQGSIALGMGFVITEDEAKEMIERDPKNKEVLSPYLNGKDLNSHPEQRASRWAINFWDWPEDKAQEYEEPYRIVLETVKPERQRRKENGEFQLEDPLPQRWWQYKRRCPALYHAIGRGRSFIEHPEGWSSSQVPMDRVLGITRVSKYLNVAFLENSQVFTLDIFVFALNTFQDFALLSSNIHEVWTRKQSSTQETRLRYTATDCYETLPYPTSLGPSLGDLGKSYEELRRNVMQDQGIGLTKLYNQFHDRSNKDKNLLTLRELHQKIDQAVAIAYGWGDVELGHDFHEIDYLPEGDRVRFTISEEARLEVLRRLSKLNKARFDEQPQSSPAAKPANANGASIEDDEPEDDLFARGGGKA
jgi:hypothetical protein